MSTFRRKREYGEEQPYIPAGIFKIRLPFFHWKWSWPEGIQSFILVAVALAAVPFIQTALDTSFEVAVLMVLIANGIYMLHPTFGDPVFPGWITAGIPLVLAHLSAYESGPERVHALIALQMLVALLFIVLGATGLAKKIVTSIPISMRGGVLLGAAFAAIFGIIGPESIHFQGREISGSIGIVTCLIVLYSLWFTKLQNRSTLLRLISKIGMLASMIIAMVIGLAVGELPMPVIEWGITPLPFRELITNYTIFGLGFPRFGFFLAAAPLAFLLYLIAFGEVVVSETIMKDADASREDEKVDYSVNRANIIIGARNAILSFVAPFPPLAGPIWVGGTVSTVERFKHGRASMDSIYDGMSTFILGIAAAILVLPLITLLAPAFPIGMIITMTLTGFACSYVAMNMLKTREDQGIAVIMGVTIFARGAAFGLITGLILHLAINLVITPWHRSKSKENP